MQTLTLIVPVETDAQRSAAGRLKSTVLKLAGGYSEYAGRGVWRDDSGAPIAEEHLRIEVFGARDVCALICSAHRTFGREAGEFALARIEDGTPVIEPTNGHLGGESPLGAHHKA